MKTASSPQLISREELQKKMENPDNLQIVNVLSPDFYDQGLIPGSIKIPLAELDKRYTELDAKREIVTYCAGPHCTASKQAAELLAKKGFKVRAYEGGLEEWKALKLPLEKNITEPLDQPSGLSGLPNPR